MKLRVERRYGRGDTGSLFQISSVQQYEDATDRWTFVTYKVDMGQHFSDENQLLTYLKSIFGKDVVLDDEDQPDAFDLKYG